MEQQTIDRLKSGLDHCCGAEPISAICEGCPYFKQCRDGWDKHNEVPGTHLMHDAREYINLLEKQAANELVWHKREEAESMKLKNTGRYLCRCMFKYDDIPFDPDEERYAYYCCLDWVLFRYVHNEETGQNEQIWEPHFSNEGDAGMVVTHFADFARPKVGDLPWHRPE